MSFNGGSSDAAPVARSVLIDGPSVGFGESPYPEDGESAYAEFDATFHDAADHDEYGQSYYDEFDEFGGSPDGYDESPYPLLVDAGVDRSHGVRGWLVDHLALDGLRGRVWGAGAIVATFVLLAGVITLVSDDADDFDLEAVDGGSGVQALDSPPAADWPNVASALDNFRDRSDDSLTGGSFDVEPTDQLGAEPADELGAEPADELGAEPTDELGADESASSPESTANDSSAGEEDSGTAPTVATDSPSSDETPSPTTTVAPTTTVGPTTTSTNQATTSAPATTAGATCAANAEFERVFRDDFNGSAVSGSWNQYNSVGHAGNGLRRPSAITVSGGLLNITAQANSSGEVVSGGMSHDLTQTYGKYVARVRTDADPGISMSGVVLTWPASNVHPRDGENDFYETLTKNSSRNPFFSFIHKPFGQTGDQEHKQWNADGTVFQTMTMEWTPSRITITREGPGQVTNETWTVNETSANLIPDVAHRLAIQLDAKEPRIEGVVGMQVDYVEVYKYCG